MDEITGLKHDQQHPYRWLVLFAVLTGNVMSPFASSTVNIALPTISHEFNLDVSSASWIPMIYLLVTTSLVLVFGRLGDMKGYRGMYLTGLCIFATGSVLCALSGGFLSLTLARAIQAVGSGMFSAMVPAIIVRVFPSNERGRALGLLGMTVAVGLSLGPPVSGFLVSHFGWRFIFYANLPLTVVAFLWGRSVLPLDTSKESGRMHREGVVEANGNDRAGFDVQGAVWVGLGLTLLILLVNKGRSWGHLSARSLSTGGLSLAFLVLFARREARASEPLLDLRIFENTGFTLGNLAATANFMGQYMMIFLTPFYLEQIVKLAPSASGRVMMAFPLVTLFIAPLSGVITDKVGVRLPAATGAFIAAVALFLMACFSATSAGVTGELQAHTAGSKKAPLFETVAKTDGLPLTIENARTETLEDISVEEGGGNGQQIIENAPAGTSEGAIDNIQEQAAKPPGNGVTAAQTTVLGLALFGLGTGLFQSPNNSAVLGSVPKHYLGIAGGVLTTTRNLGMVLGIAFGASVFAARHQAYILRGFWETSAYLLALRDSYLLAAIVAFAAVPLSLFISGSTSPASKGPAT